MNKIPGKLAGLGLALILISGCYHNGHIRSQRILEPDEKVISGHMGLNLVAPTNFEGSYRFRNSGISGARLGLSYLQLYKGYEQGPSIGLGLLEDNYDFILGYDIRKVRINPEGRPYRYGLYIEANSIMGGDYSSLKGGTIFQLRPYVISATSKQHKWYAGFHGLGSFGSLNGSEWGYYDSSSDTWFDREIGYDYSVSSFGAGITLGNEFQIGWLIIQSQLDLSVINQKHRLIGDYPYANDWDWEPVNIDGPVISIGTAIHMSPPGKTPKVKAPQVIEVNRVAQEKKISYDPFTGQAIQTEKPEVSFNPLTGMLVQQEAGEIHYDPISGELLEQEQTPEFDPLTGLTYVEPAIIEAQSLLDLLSEGEQKALMKSGLKIITLNGRSVNASLLNVTDEGLVIFNNTYGQSGQETLFYNRIQYIRFEGEMLGINGGLKTGLKSCGYCLGVPLGISLVSGDFGLLGLGILAAPVVGLAGLIYGSLETEKYGIRFYQSPAHLPQFTNSMEYRKQTFLKFVRMYLKSGFPEYELTQAPAGVTP